jgi:DNA-directed RNA polymerase subunit L
MPAGEDPAVIPMELRLVRKDAQSLEIEVTGESETILLPIQQKLLADDKVEIATLTRHHRLLNEPILFVKVKEGKPQTAVKRATKALANEVKDLSQLFDAASP